MAVSVAANPLLQLTALGQSIWYDQMRRALLTSGELKRLIEQDGVRGLTSNPTIFEKAIGGSTDYVKALDELAEKGAGVDEIYESLVVEDIGAAADIFRPLYNESGGTDGFCSLEVSPKLAYDTQGTVAEAKRLNAALNRPNVMIKIPATAEGIPTKRRSRDNLLAAVTAARRTCRGSRKNGRSRSAATWRR